MACSVIHRVGLGVAMALCVFASGCAGTKPPIDAPLAAVMAGKGQVILVDLERGTVIDSVTMRSWTGDIEADPSTGTFVTSQCGGVGDEADDKIGVIDVRGDRSIRYVGLHRRNPLGVEVIAPGKVLVDHGWEERDGVYACIVDIRKSAVVKEGHIPGNNEPTRFAGGMSWASCVDVSTDETSLRRIDVGSLKSRVVLTGRGYASVQCETPFGLAGWLGRKTESPVLARFNAITGAVDATASAGLVDGAGRLVYAAEMLVAVDFTGEDMNHPGNRLLVFDAKTLHRERVIPLDGGPTDIAAWGDRVVVVSWMNQTLQVVDPTTGSIDTTVRLPAKVKLPLQVAVMEG